MNAQQVQKRMRLLRRFVQRPRPQIRALAKQVAGDPAKLWALLKERHRYVGVRSAKSLGFFEDPVRTLEIGFGDGEDWAIVVASILSESGIAFVLRALSQVPPVPYGHFHHIYTVAIIDGVELPIDLEAGDLGAELDGVTLDEERS